MGRLTLNVLLSFAQFEREVTAERIRDKIAASKAKGMWMGGAPPLGYDVKDRRLLINEPEAERVRTIYQRYLEVGSIVALAQVLKREGVASKSWTSQSGRAHAGAAFWPGALASILSNPLYRGLIKHRNKIYSGRHDAIISEEIWDAVQEKRAANRERKARLPQRIDGALLAGKVRDDAGNVMRISFTRKGDRRYRYYVSGALLDRQGKPGSLPRVSAGSLDRAVQDALAPLLDKAWLSHEPTAQRIRAAVRSVEVSARKLRLTVEYDAIDVCQIDALEADHRNGCLVFDCAITLARPRNATTLIGASDGGARIDRSLVRALAMARAWADQLESGEVQSVVDLAAAEKRCLNYTNKLLPLAYLAPDLVETILTGRQARGLTLSALLAVPMPTDWSAQRQMIAALC